MKTPRKRILSLLCAAALTVGSLSAAASADGEEPTVGNRAKQDYSTWASPVTSYLYEDSDGVTRVEYTGLAVLVEDYDAQFALQNSTVFPVELPLWGGFFAGETYNYFFFGQENPEEDDGREVVRVVQYDKDWNRLGSASLYGANTTRPFRAGSLRCDEYGGYLYVRTCHEMYRSEDGYNHQASLTFCLRQSDLEITDSLSAIATNAAGYVSHSFNQFILVDEEGRIITMDHGDAYPRALVMMQYRTRAGGDTFVTRNGRYYNCVKSLELVTFPGLLGANVTNASAGGLAETSEGYLAAYSIDDTNTGIPRAVYLAFVPKGDISTATPYVQALSNPGASTPQIVSTGLTGGYVLWNGIDGVSLYCVQYAADGTVTGLVQGVAPLSDCRPIPYGDSVLWYVTDGSQQPTFYSLNIDGVKSYTVGDAAPQPTEPQPTEPQPTEPQPTEPQPTEPQPTEPQPTEPQPTEPQPTEPQPTEPQPTEPQPTEPQPTEPQPTEPQSGFIDVADGVWYAPYAAAAAEGGLMQGTGDARFSPLRTLTIAEVVTLSARLHAQFSGLSVPASQPGEAWYLASYRYCVDNALFTSQELPESVLTSPATRFWMIDLLDRAVPDHEKQPVLTDVTVPDVAPDAPYGELVYRWYAAGITQGDEKGRFNGTSSITRAEMATILCRLARLTPRIGG